jgi:peptide/nickel transport system substrate-binding protein
MRIARPSFVITALALAGTTTITACTAATSSTQPTGPGGSFGTIPVAAAGPRHSGAITWAEPPTGGPTWILPITTANAYDNTDVMEFEYQMWRPMYWFDDGVQPIETPGMSLAYAPKWSNGDRTVTITLKSTYKWSDGQPISSRDVLFFYDEVKAAVKLNPANWGSYSPGLGIPDEVASVTTPTASTVVFAMKKPVNPEWFLEDELASVSPMPAHAWARASADGPILDFTVAANAAKIYEYLSKESMSLGTYATDPLWRVVDGPYRLTAFDRSTSAFTMTPNPSYGGPHATTVSTLQAVPYVSPAAEFNAVRTGSVDVGYLPVADVSQAKTIESGGYNVFGYPNFGFGFVVYNFADTTGDFNKIIAQLYVRQALAHLVDEQGYIKAFFGGAAGLAYGPIPVVPASPFVPADAVTDPYPFSVPTAISLLRSHGWSVTTAGTDTCAKAGTGPGDCGAGIAAGTRLEFNLIYASELATIGDMVTALASEAARAGITIHLQSSNYNYIVTHYDNRLYTPAYVDKWAMEDFGGWQNPVYPTTLGLFNGPGPLNAGSYNSATANSLIDGSLTSSDPAAVMAEASYLTENQPVLFLPAADKVAVWKKDLSGPPGSFAALTQYYLDPEYWYFTG